MHMATEQKVWTLAELHSLPDDGNKYELVHGELFVTPAPSMGHEEILARLTELLVPFVAANGLGRVYRPRAVLRFQGSEVEPDLMVRRQPRSAGNDWENAPTPILVVEVPSPYTRRRVHQQKRDFYREAGVEEYWIVDPEMRTCRVVRQGEVDRVEHESVTWAPSTVPSSLTIRLSDVFGGPDSPKQGA